MCCLSFCHSTQYFGCMRTWLRTPIHALNRSISCVIKYSVTKIRTTIQKSKTKQIHFPYGSIMVSLLIPFMPSRKPVISEVIIDYKKQIQESLTTFVHMIIFKEASGRFFFHFLVDFEKCIEYIRIFFIHFTRRGIMWFE